ncbi:MAG: hypothetical protein WC895_03020 [Candidatus Shapirobacteria bacterium]|jgi:hypothetical protein
MINKFDTIKVLIVLLISPFLVKIFSMPLGIALITLVLWFLIVKFKNKIAWLVFLILILVNLYINRLLYFDINSWKVSFDLEQSFFKYPGIGEAIIRYRQEGLWIPYLLRNIFYSSYLILFSWISLIMKLLSPIFWVKMIGFSGFSLMVAGIIHFFKTKNKNYFMVWWFLLILITSSLRVLGDSFVAIYLTLPVIIYWLYLGFKSKLFENYHMYWYILFLIDLLLR